MASKRMYQVRDYLYEGKLPSEIANLLGCDVESVEANMFKAASKELISFVDIYLAVCGHTVKAIEADDDGNDQMNLVEQLRRIIQQNLIDQIDQQVEAYRESYTFQKFERHAIAEHYMQIREIERTMHRSIRDSLIRVFGDAENEW